ncbi:General transcription factor 3C polypeptide 1 [Orchesella cincta]|uniref:General transcription factor 3C polypeptide 1 n=1 Tax=Orchesella cincta TaxID=48709 RepID=A0A1D2MXI4_ORCCI|nr:General transcription factor 3C polypeptide 1 [Orchesella cincta]
MPPFVGGELGYNTTNVPVATDRGISNNLTTQPFQGHYYDHIIDEIALEGLDGITLQALGIRLEQRPNFEMEGFEDVAAATWNQLKLSKSLRFFVLPSDRPDLVKYSWDDYRDDRGNVYEPLHAPEDIYPYFPVEDKTAGLRGSCEHYQTRKDVSIVVRRVPYAQSIRLFGSRLIIVAVQSVREKALFGTNFKKHQGLSVVQYCMVERIGRARHKGEITRGKISLQIMKIPPKILFYMRKALLATKVVIKQNASVKFENCKCPALITVFHLPRFYKRIESVASLNARIIFTQLNQSETKSILSEQLYQMGDRFKPPSLDEILELGTKRRKIKKIIDDAEPAESGDQDEKKVSCKTSNSFSGIQVLRPYQELTSLTQSFVLCRALVRSGVKGLTAKDMRFLCTTRLEARSATRYLTRYHVAKEGVVKHFKQKSFTYTFNKFAGNEAEEISSSLHEPYDKVMSELVEMRKMLAEATETEAKKRKQSPLHHHSTRLCEATTKGCDRSKSTEEMKWMNKFEKECRQEICKDSLAIQRRLHFLMNQKSYYDVYVGMMGAALRDETLYLNYVKDFMRPPQPRIYHLPPRPALNSVIEYLSLKFDNENYEVADIRGNLNEIETTLFIRQLTRLEYHWKALMFLLFCSLGKNTEARHHYLTVWRKFIKDNRNVLETEEIEVSEESDNDGRIKKHETKPDISAQPSLESSVVSSSSDENSSSEEEQEVQQEDVVTMHHAVAEKKSSNNLECSTDEEDFERNSADRLELDYCFKFMRFFMKHCEILFRQMARLNASDERKFSLVASDMNATSPNICYTARECTSDLEIRQLTARCVILDHIMTGDASRKAEKFTKAIPIYKAGRNLQRARILVYNRATRLLGISKLMLRQLGNGLPSASYDDALDFVKYLEEAPSIDSSACINFGILSCLVELTDHFRSTIRITEPIIALNDEWAPVYDDMIEESDIAAKNSRKSTKRKESEADEDSPRPMKRRKFSADERKEVEGIMECFEEMERELPIRKPRDAKDGEKGNYTNSSTNALRLLRIRLNEAGLHMPGKQFTGLVEKEICSINLPNLEFTLRKTRSSNNRVSEKFHPFSNDFQKTIDNLRGDLIELVYHKIDADLDKTVEKVLENIGKYRILFELIDMAGSQGLSAIFLLTKFTKPSLAKGLHYLVDAKLIFTVGVKNRRFVTFNNSKDWLIAIRNQSNKEILGHAIMRPWLTAHGAISWVTVNRLVIALLGQLQKPSTDLDEVCQLLQPILSPVETLILIEIPYARVQTLKVSWVFTLQILVKIKFLMVYKLTEKEPELFSQHPLDKSEIEYHVDTLVDTEDVFVSVSPYTTFLHAQLQEIILKECGTKED